MTIQDIIYQDQAAVDAAVEKMLQDSIANQDILNAANNKLAQDMEKLAGLKPQLDLIGKIEAELATIEDGISEELKSALDAVKKKITSFLDEMKNILNG